MLDSINHMTLKLHFWHENINILLSFKLHTILMDAITLCYYGKCSKISNTLKLRTPKIITENNFKNILKNRTLSFFGKMNF